MVYITRCAYVQSIVSNRVGKRIYADEKPTFLKRDWHLKG